MRKFLLTALLASTPISAAIADDENHFYGGFELGLSHSPSSDLVRAGDGLNLSADKNWGPVGGLYFGKKTGKNRFELEYLLRRVQFSNIDVLNAGATSLASTGRYQAGGSQKTSSFMFNMWRTLAGSEDWSFLGGIGAGLSHVTLDRFRNGRNELVNTADWAPALQAMAQLVKPIGAGLEAGLGYRYHHNFSSDFKTNLGTADYSPSHHEVFARISWRFGGEPAAPKAAAAPTPVVAPAPRKPAITAVAPRPDKPLTRAIVMEPMPLPTPYIVFFDFDKVDITAPAAQIIADAAHGFKEFKAIEIQASGHADRSGPAKYNGALAQKRVEAVRDALVRAGVPADKIKLSSHGEDKMRVSTKDGTRESQNRRVEIKLVR